jgi:hypothetical protein
MGYDKLIQFAWDHPLFLKVIVYLICNCKIYSCYLFCKQYNKIVCAIASISMKFNIIFEFHCNFLQNNVRDLKMYMLEA